MKNQYVGDIGDFAKYYLLRQLANSGLRIGVNWYLTEDDYGKDGKDYQYLFLNAHNEKYKGEEGDKDLYEHLQCIVKENIEAINRIVQKRDVFQIQKRDIIKDAAFYTRTVPKQCQREEWFKRAISFFERKQVAIIFLDPDNGIQPQLKGKEDNTVKENIKATYSVKHITPKELECAYGTGKTIILYQHKRRYKKLETMHTELIKEIRTAIKDEKTDIITYETSKCFFFIMQKGGVSDSIKQCLKEMKYAKIAEYPPGLKSRGK
jgi:rubrerythrin